MEGSTTVQIPDHVDKAWCDQNIDVEACSAYRKVALTRAIRMAGPFTVETSEGPLTCQDGYLCFDARGYPYPVAADEFALIYRPAEHGRQDDEDAVTALGQRLDELAEELEQAQSRNTELQASLEQALGGGPVAMPTFKQLVDAALAAIGNPFSYGREIGPEFSLAIRHLEDAKMRYTRGRCKQLGVFNEIDIDAPAGQERAQANHEANVAGNADDSPQRS